MNWIRNFMFGRYGNDELNMALVIASIILTVLSNLTRSLLIHYLSYIPLIYFVYRMLSKDIVARQRENYKFLPFWNKSIVELKQLKARFDDRKTHKYFKCPNCKQTVRVPRGKGTIKINCPKCHTSFTKKS